jgi:hypothetical protein
MLALIVDNGGQPIQINQHGAAGDGLPFVPPSSLTQLRRNDLLTVRAEGGGFRVGLGSRTRRIAKRWGIELPQVEAPEQAA